MDTANDIGEALLNVQLFLELICIVKHKEQLFFKLSSGRFTQNLIETRSLFGFVLNSEGALTGLTLRVSREVELSHSSSQLS